jgi:single-strand DNA-binding protein
LKPRTYETKTGEKRTVIEFEIDEIGLSLRYASATAKGPQPKRPLTDEPHTQNEAPTQDEAPRRGWKDGVKALQKTGPVEAGHGGYSDDDPWFGKNATGEGYTQPAPTAEPTF